MPSQSIHTERPLDESAKPRRPLHIHFFGGPGVGKSTLAPAVYAELKVRGVRAEMVMEVAKELLWENRLSPHRQMLTTAEQMNREERLRPHADVIVSESPGLLGVVYALPEQKESLRQCVLSVTHSWERLSYFIDRDLRENYEEFGRLENAEEARYKSQEIRNLLAICRVPYVHLHMESNPQQVWEVSRQICDRVAKEYGLGVKPNALHHPADGQFVRQG